MAEVSTDLKKAVEDGEAQAPEGTPTAEEVEAAKGGWVPEAEFEGTGWIGAKEFNGRAPLYDGLSKQSKRIKTLEGVVKSLAEQNKEVGKRALEKAKSELKAERVRAHEEEDHERAVELEDEQRKLDAEEQRLNEDAVSADAQAFADWRAAEGNEWFDSNADVRMFAESYGAQLAQTSHGLSNEEFYNKVGDKVKTVFPNLFKGKLPDRGAAPGTGKTTGGKGKDATYAMLTSEQKKVCREFENMGVMTKEDYVKQLADAGLIEKV